LRPRGAGSVKYDINLCCKRENYRRGVPASTPGAASADRRGFLIIYERRGHQLNLADVYELTDGRRSRSRSPPSPCLRRSASTPASRTSWGSGDASVRAW